MKLLFFSLLSITISFFYSYTASGEYHVMYNEETGESEEFYFDEEMDEGHGNYGPPGDCCETTQADEYHDTKTAASANYSMSRSECRAAGYSPANKCSRFKEADQERMSNAFDRKLARCNSAQFKAEEACVVQQNHGGTQQSSEASATQAVCKKKDSMNQQHLEAKKQKYQCAGKISACEQTCQIDVHAISSALETFATNLSQDLAHQKCGALKNNNLKALEQIEAATARSSAAVKNACNNLKNVREVASEKKALPSPATPTPTPTPAPEEDETLSPTNPKNSKNNSNEEGIPNIEAIGEMASSSEQEDFESKPKERAHSYVSSLKQGFTSSNKNSRENELTNNGDSHSTPSSEDDSALTTGVEITENNNHFSYQINVHPKVKPQIKPEDSSTDIEHPSNLSSTEEYEDSWIGPLTEERNHINEYMVLTPKDRGAPVSIKRRAFKKYGVPKLKAKLKEARKKVGYNVPLIFKNGRFVKDFLAQKELRKNKNKNKSSRTRAPASVVEICNPKECHQNAKLNIFRIMNFRIRKQLVTIQDL